MQELIRYDPVFLTVFVLLGYKKLFSTSPNTVSSILMLIALSYASSSLVKLAMSSSSSSTRSEDWMHAPEPTDPQKTRLIESFPERWTLETSPLTLRRKLRAKQFSICSPDPKFTPSEHFRLARAWSREPCRRRGMGKLKA
jgi:hypothetical protein